MKITDVKAELEKIKGLVEGFSPREEQPFGEKFEVRLPNKRLICVINSRLVRRQKVSDENLEKIKELHVQKHLVLMKMKKLKTKKSLREQAAKITEIEFALQEAWGFPKDINYHRFWDVCGHCPQMDNEDAYGTGYNVINLDCPIHGSN